MTAFQIGAYLVTKHADDEMDEDDVTIDNIEKAICDDDPRIIEQDERRSLILAWITDREPIHAVVACNSPTDVRLITVYRPDRSPDRWSADYERRL